MNLIEATNYFLPESHNPLNLSNNMEIIPQTNNLGQQVPFTWFDDRIFLDIDAHGKTIHIYQSSSGTSGKTIGTWYPCGPVIDDQKTGFVWIVKDDGNIPGLVSTMREINQVLPHSEDDTLEFLRSITDGGLSRGWGDVVGPEYWIKTQDLGEALPNIDIYNSIKRRDVSMKNDGYKNSLYFILYNRWINQTINPVWGTK